MHRDVHADCRANEVQRAQLQLCVDDFDNETLDFLVQEALAQVNEWWNMHDTAGRLVFQHFKSRNLFGLQAIRHHLDKQELHQDTAQLLADIADHLHALGFDGKTRELSAEYRELLLELATIVGPIPVLMGTQRGCRISGDYELVRCLLNQMMDHQDALIVELIPVAMANSQFAVGMLLVRFYLRLLPTGRKPARKLSAMELYGAFVALSEVVHFQSHGNEKFAELELMGLMMETGCIHHMLYIAQTGRCPLSQAFYKTLNLLCPSQQQFLRQFHVRKDTGIPSIFIPVTPF